MKRTTQTNTTRPRKTALLVAMAYADMCKDMLSELLDLYKAHEVGKQQQRSKELLNTITMCNGVFTKNMCEYFGL